MASTKADEPGMTEKAMFGGLAFLLVGDMSVGLSGGASSAWVGRDG